MNRNDVFLDAMGLGPQWRLRHGSAMPDAVDDAAVDAVEAPAVAAVAERAAEPRHEQHVESPLAQTPAPVAIAAAPASETAAAGGLTPPAAPRAAPAASADDTSWFDDAPAAQVAPVTKSARPAQPARPAPQGPADAEESHAWFDDVPASPLPAARPVSQPAARPPAPQAAVPQAAASQPAARAPAPDDGAPWFDDAPFFDGVDSAIDSFDHGFGSEVDNGAMSDAAIARMDWPALRTAVQGCTRCALSRERRAAVPGRGAERAPWLVLAAAPAAEDETQVRPLAGAPGQLLDNMFKAIGVKAEPEAYVTTLVKCRPQDDRVPGPEVVAACRPYLEREMALAGTRTIVTLGHVAAKGLLGAAARGKVLRLAQIPVVATYHPADLLRKPEDKAKAWADLCLARTAFDGAAGPA